MVNTINKLTERNKELLNKIEELEKENQSLGKCEKARVIVFTLKKLSIMKKIEMMILLIQRLLLTELPIIIGVRRKNKK